jgi:hypothetical protein
MKKVFFLSVLICGSFVSKAQTHIEPGIKGGINVATLTTGSSNSNIDPRISANLGFLAHIHLTKEFALQPELIFSGQGAKQTIANVEYKTNLNYLQLPILLQYMIGTGFRIETGPQFGALVSAKNKSGNVIVNVKDSYNKVDAGWVLGAGYVTASGFGVDARYNLGLSKINESGDKISNRVFALGVFYQFKAVHTR